MRCLLFLLILGMMVCALGSVALCQAETPDTSAPAVAVTPEAPVMDEPLPNISIFNGEDPSSEGISLGGWGSGGAVKTQEQRLEGAWGIKIATQGLYSGGKIEFAQPVTLFANGNEANRYLQFTFLFIGANDKVLVNPAASTEWTWTDVEPYWKPKANKMRFVFMSDTGATVEVTEPTCALDPDDNWMRIAVPMAKLKTTDDAKDFRMKRVLVFTDTPVTFYLGSMKLVTDTDPITVDPIDPRTVAIMDMQYFVASAKGGVSSLKYSWDFDANNGIQIESTDLIAKTFYPKGGDYTVTLTVSDADGLKAPVTVRTVITVTD